MSEKGLSPYGFLVKGQGLLGREGEPGSMPAFSPAFFLAKGISRVAVFPSLPSRETFPTTCSSPPPPSTPTTVVRSHSSLLLPGEFAPSLARFASTSTSPELERDRLPLHAPQVHMRLEYPVELALLEVEALREREVRPVERVLH